MKALLFIRTSERLRGDRLVLDPVDILFKEEWAEFVVSPREAKNYWILGVDSIPADKVESIRDAVHAPGTFMDKKLHFGGGKRNRQEALSWLTSKRPALAANLVEFFNHTKAQSKQDVLIVTAAVLRNLLWNKDTLVEATEGDVGLAVELETAG